jgi:hypothetical protein
MMVEKLVGMSDCGGFGRSEVLLLMLEYPDLKWGVVVRMLKDNAYDDEAKFVGGLKEEARLA